MKTIMLILGTVFSLGANASVTVIVDKPKAARYVVTSAAVSVSVLKLYFTDEAGAENYCFFYNSNLKLMGGDALQLVKEFNSDRKFEAKCDFYQGNSYSGDHIRTSIN
jgi:hypothetical protein